LLEVLRVRRWAAPLSRYPTSPSAQRWVDQAQTCKRQWVSKPVRRGANCQACRAGGYESRDTSATSTRTSTRTSPSSGAKEWEGSRSSLCLSFFKPERRPSDVPAFASRRCRRDSCSCHSCSLRWRCQLNCRRPRPHARRRRRRALHASRGHRVASRNHTRSLGNTNK